MSEKKAKETKKAAIDWKIAADRVAIGKKTELESLPGYWVTPRRFTKQGEAEILAAQTRAVAESQALTAEFMAGFAEPMSDTERVAGVSDDAKQKIMQQVTAHATAGMVGRVEENTLRLLYGIEATNMTDDEKPSREWAEDVMQYTDTADEILKLIGEQNLPLSLRMSRKSETLPTGSMTEPVSTDQAASTN